jgi:hypothetical protein
MPFPGLLKTIMAGKFESQFKHRDEASVNAPAATASAKMQKSLDFPDASAGGQIRLTVPIFRQR